MNNEASHAEYPIKTLNANGLSFGYFEAGKGPLVFLLHGFPDTAHGYLKMLPMLATAGYRVVAPFLRGYAPSDLAADGDYSLPALARDLLAQIEHLGQGEKALVVGHDWGSPITQYAANLRPDRFEKIVLCSVPQLRRFLLSPSAAQLKRSHYVLRFQVPRWAEKHLPKNDFAWMREQIFQRWSPTYAFSEEELAPILKNFSDRARLKAAVDYYRALPALIVNLRQARSAFRAITVPTMMVHGSEDGCIGAEMFQKQEKRFKAEYELVEAPGMGHFLQYENPQWFADQIIRYFAKA